MTTNVTYNLYYDISAVLLNSVFIILLFFRKKERVKMATKKDTAKETEKKTKAAKTTKAAKAETKTDALSEVIEE